MAVANAQTSDPKLPEAGKNEVGQDGGGKENGQAPRINTGNVDVSPLSKELFGGLEDKGNEELKKILLAQNSLLQEVMECQVVEKTVDQE